MEFEHFLSFVKHDGTFGRDIFPFWKFWGKIFDGSENNVGGGKREKINKRKN